MRTPWLLLLSTIARLVVLLGTCCTRKKGPYFELHLLNIFANDA